MTPPTPPAPHAQTLEKAIDYAIAIMGSHRDVAAPVHAIAIQRHMDALAALRAPADAPDGTREALEKAFDAGWQAHKKYLDRSTPDGWFKSDLCRDAIDKLLAASPAPAPTTERLMTGEQLAVLADDIADMAQDFVTARDAKSLRNMAANLAGMIRLHVPAPAPSDDGGPNGTA